MPDSAHVSASRALPSIIRPACASWAMAVCAKHCTCPPWLPGGPTLSSNRFVIGWLNGASARWPSWALRCGSCSVWPMASSSRASLSTPTMWPIFSLPLDFLHSISVVNLGQVIPWADARPGQRGFEALGIFHAALNAAERTHHAGVFHQVPPAGCLHIRHLALVQAQQFAFALEHIGDVHIVRGLPFQAGDGVHVVQDGRFGQR